MEFFRTSLIPEILSGYCHTGLTDIEYSEFQRTNMYKRVIIILAVEFEPLLPTELRTTISPERIPYAFHVSVLVQTTSALHKLLIIVAVTQRNGDEEEEEGDE